MTIDFELNDFVIRTNHGNLNKHSNASLTLLYTLFYIIVYYILIYILLYTCILYTRDIYIYRSAYNYFLILISVSFLKHFLRVNIEIR